jgi:hypothetical protein
VPFFALAKSDELSPLRFRLRTSVTLDMSLQNTGTTLSRFNPGDARIPSDSASSYLDDVTLCFSL